MEELTKNDFFNVEQNSKTLLKPQYIYHIFFVNDSDDKLNHKDIIFPENFSQEDINKKLKEFNDNGYNIYKTFNTFIGGKRSTENVFEFKGILIDLDYTQEEKEDYISILSHCNKIKNKYGIFPVEINETYKGYHLIYALENKLMFIKNELYIDLSKILIGEFNADFNAKQITGLYKVHGFIDHKKDNSLKKGRNFRIINKFTQPKNKYYEISIKEQHLKIFGLLKEKDEINNYLRRELLGKRIYWNKMSKGLGISEKAEIFLAKHILNLKQKELKKKRYNLLIESIDAKEWIDSINDAYSKGKPGFDKPVVIKKDGISIDDTDGLKLFFNKDIQKYQIKDFSKGIRFGNKKFLFNHYFQIHTLSKKEQKVRLLQYLDFISKYFGINPNVSVSKIVINEKILHDYIKDKIYIDEKGIIEENKNNINYDWFRFYFLIIGYIQINNIKPDDFGNYSIVFDNFIDFCGYGKQINNNKKYIKDILYYINKLYVIYSSGKNQKKVHIANFNIVDNLIQISFDNILQKTQKISYLSINLGYFAKKKTESKKTKFAATILYGLSNFGSVKLKITGENSLGYSLANTKRLLLKMRKEKLIEDFYFKNNYVYVGSKKYLQSLGKRNINKNKKRNKKNTK